MQHPIVIVVALRLEDGTAQILPFGFGDSENAGLFVDDVYNDYPDALITCELAGKPATWTREADGNLLFRAIESA